MPKTILALVAAFALASMADAASAAQCRDAHGKFIKCPPPAAAKHCKDAKTHKFAKCGAPGAVPA